MSTRLYLVSFSDSRQFRIFCEPGGECKKTLEDIEGVLRDTLAEKFPGEPLAYFYTPRVVEIESGHEEKYRDYPMLDSEALAEIAALLEKEVRERAELESLDNNAPWSDAD